MGSKAVNIEKKEEQLPIPHVVDSINYDWLEFYFGQWCVERQLTIKEAEVVLDNLRAGLKNQLCGGFRPSTANGKPIKYKVKVEIVEHHD